MARTHNESEFNNPRICLVMPKYTELDRILIGLYMLLKYDGRRPVARKGRKEVDLQYITNELLTQHQDLLKGFAEHRAVLEDWLHSDLVDIVYRGHPDKERVASPRPLHLNAYKLRNTRFSQEYRAPEHLFSMIRHVDPELVKRLRNFLGKGMDADSQDQYDGQTELDLDTFMIVNMVDNPHLREDPSGQSPRLDPPLCTGQARLLCSDLRRLLVYENSVPRPVMIEYLRTALGLHLGLYILRLFNQLSGWVSNKTAHLSCLNCPVLPEQSDTPYAACPFAFQHQDEQTKFQQSEILVDMGEDFTSHMAYLSQKNCEHHFKRVNDYIHAVFTVNQLFQYAESHAGQRHIQGRVETVAEAIELLNAQSVVMDVYFSDKIDKFSVTSNDEEERGDFLAIQEMEGLSAFERYVELLTLDRSPYYQRHITSFLDSILMKNQDTGLSRQGKGKRNGRRWHLSSRLLEMLVQIAVLESTDQGADQQFHSRPILIDDFVRWLRNRYGIELAPQWANATIQDYTAFNENLKHLKNRLREIGFYTDLSDAYNAQVIRPRYPIDVEGSL